MIVNKAGATPHNGYANVYTTAYAFNTYYDQYNYTVAFGKTFANFPDVCVGMPAIKFRYCESANGHCFAVDVNL